ncbi:protealysin inhibitor emfourin [Scytonema sp. PCC 10023]|uniref:protealysin inhibitor emfourin n=1 Tax=Scytonema sp. PCC 10023 TaxID=1680591 RepID=UPI0039C61733
MMSWTFSLVVPIIGLLLAAFTPFSVATQVMAAAHNGMHFNGASELQLHKAKEEGSDLETKTPCSKLLNDSDCNMLSETLEPNDIRIRFEQSGGLIGKPKTLDMEGKEFPDEDLAKIRELVRQSDFFDMPEPQRSNIPDAHTVMMHIEHEGRSRTMVVTRETAPPALKELIKVLEKFASY